MEIFYDVTLLDTPTMRLLNSSTVVAISGAFRLHIAFLLAGIAMRIPEYCAFSLIVYATYTLDRALDCKEDAINRCEITGADKKTGILACLAAFLIGAVILLHDGILLAPFFPFIVGYAYTHGFRVGSYTVKLKAGAGVKNAIIGLTWGGTIALIVGQWCGSIVTVGVIFLFFGLKVFVTSCVNDFKDIKGDMAAGIRTLPVCLGEDLTKKVLILILFVMHGIVLYALLSNIIRDEWLVLLTGLVITVVFLFIYSPSFETSPQLMYRKMREFAISWESLIALAIRGCVTV